MKKVKITILKTMLNEDLAKEYGICGVKACPMMKVGDVFYADSIEKTILIFLGEYFFEPSSIRFPCHL